MFIIPAEDGIISTGKDFKWSWKVMEIFFQKTQTPCYRHLLIWHGMTHVICSKFGQGKVKENYLSEQGQPCIENSTATGTNGELNNGSLNVGLQLTLVAYTKSYMRNLKSQRIFIHCGHADRGGHIYFSPNVPNLQIAVI